MLRSIWVTRNLANPVIQDALDERTLWNRAYANHNLWRNLSCGSVHLTLPNLNHLKSKFRFRNIKVHGSYRIAKHRVAWILNNNHLLKTNSLFLDNQVVPSSRSMIGNAIFRSQAKGLLRSRALFSSPFDSRYEFPVRQKKALYEIDQKFWVASSELLLVEYNSYTRLLV